MDQKQWTKILLLKQWNIYRLHIFSRSANIIYQWLSTTAGQMWPFNYNEFNTLGLCPNISILQLATAYS